MFSHIENTNKNDMYDHIQTLQLWAVFTTHFFLFCDLYGSTPVQYVVLYTHRFYFATMDTPKKTNAGTISVKKGRIKAVRDVELLGIAERNVRKIIG